MPSSLTILLPTYNEKQNVLPMIARLETLFPEGGELPIPEILFVDDSNDETPEIIQETAKNSHLNIRLLHRPPEERTGLATAFVEGFRQAQGKLICCIDSDLQHPPEVILDLIRKAKDTGADIVVATRYIQGGSAEGLGGTYRRLVSLGLKYFTQIIFIPTRQTTDPGSGFFLLKKSIVKDADLRPKGFKILIEILMRAPHGQVAEVPYCFLKRENEESKATVGQGIAFFKQLWLIFTTVPEAGRFFKFCLVGGSGVIVNLGLLYFLVEGLDWSKNPAWLTAVIISIFSNYFLNNLFTYGDQKSRSQKESLKRVVYYYVISFFTIAFNFIIFRAAINFGLYYLLASLLGIILTTLLNFILVTKIIWKKNKNEKLF